MGVESQRKNIQVLQEISKYETIIRKYVSHKNNNQPALKARALDITNKDLENDKRNLKKYLPGEVEQTKAPPKIMRDVVHLDFSLNSSKTLKNSREIFSDDKTNDGGTITKEDINNATHRSIDKDISCDSRKKFKDFELSSIEIFEQFKWHTTIETRCKLD